MTRYPPLTLDCPKHREGKKGHRVRTLNLTIYLTEKMILKGHSFNTSKIYLSPLKEKRIRRNRSL